MRRAWPLSMLLMLCAPASWAQADQAGNTAQDSDAHDGRHDRRPQVSSKQCGLRTDFNVLADSGGIWLYRDSGSPREIFFHGGELSVDRKVRAVSDADRQRLWDMERETRALMPQVTAVAQDVIDLSYDALGGVIEIMTGSWFNARKIERMRKQAHGYVDGTLGKGRWDQDSFDGSFERYVQDQAEEFKGSIARHLLFQIATGRADAIEERGDRIGDELDDKLDARSDAIEAKADALCAQVDKLRVLQDALEFRDDGQPLQMLAAIEDAGGSDAPDSAAADADKQQAQGSQGANEDVPRDSAIKVSPKPSP